MKEGRKEAGRGVIGALAATALMHIVAYELLVAYFIGGLHSNTLRFKSSTQSFGSDTRTHLEREAFHLRQRQVRLFLR